MWRTCGPRRVAGPIPTRWTWRGAPMAGHFCRPSSPLTGSHARASTVYRSSWPCEGDEAYEATAAACTTVPVRLVRSLVNKHGKTLVHADPRDAGAWAQLLGAASAEAAGIEVITHRFACPPPANAQPDFLQTVVIIFKGCSECEALACDGPPGGLVAPLTDPEDICMAMVSTWSISRASTSRQPSPG